MHGNSKFITLYSDLAPANVQIEPHPYIKLKKVKASGADGAVKGASVLSKDRKIK